LRVVEPTGHSEDAVQHLALNAVTTLVEETQLGIGEPANPALAIVVEPGGCHPVRAVDASGDVLAARRAHATGAAEGSTLLRDPGRPFRTVLYVGHPVLHRGRRAADEEIGGEPAEIDVTVSRDHLVTHREPPPGERCRRAHLT